MTDAGCIAREECEDPLGPSAWLMPLIILFQSLFLVFTNVRERLGEMRRSRRLPKDWQSHYPRLREAEWPIAFILSEAASQLLAGQDLDLRAIPDPGDAPDGFQPAMPRSALAMHKRTDAIARFNAEPEKYVRRHAERIARAAAGPAPAATAAAAAAAGAGFRKRAGIGGPLSRIGGLPASPHIHPP